MLRRKLLIDCVSLLLLLLVLFSQQNTVHCEDESDEDGVKYVHLKGNSDVNIAVVTPLWGSNYSLNYETGVLPLLAAEFTIEHLHRTIIEGVERTFPNRTDLSQGIVGFKLVLKDQYYCDSNEKHDRTAMAQKIMSWRLERRIPLIFGAVSTNDLVGLEFVRLRSPTPIFSHIASSTYLDDYALDWFNEMLSSVPSDVYRIQALIDLLNRFKWKYIGIVSSYGFEGYEEVVYFLKKTKKLDICVPVIKDLSDRDTDLSLDEALLTASNNTAINVLVLFTNDIDSRAVLSALKRQNLVDRFTLLFIYGSLSYIEVTRGYEDVAEGSLAIDYQTQDPPGFIDWLITRNPQNSQSVHFHLYWESVFECRLNTSRPLRKMRPPKRKYYAKVCTGEEFLSDDNGVYEMSHAGRMFHSLSLATNGFFSIFYDLCSIPCKANQCPSINETCPFSIRDHQTMETFLRRIFGWLRETRYNARFTKFFYRDGDVRRYSNKDRFYYELITYGNGKPKWIGYWNFKIPFGPFNYPILPETLLSAYKPDWFLKYPPYWKNHTGTIPPTSVCSEECLPGYRREYEYEGGTRTLGRFCCWKCIQCPKNNILENLYTCQSCNYVEIANLTSNKCIALPEHILDINSSSSTFVYILTGFSGLGAILVLFVVCVFVLYNDNHIVRAAGRDLCYGILLGVFGMFMSTIVYLKKPTPVICGARDILPSLSLLTCYAALFMKIYRIYRVFTSAKSRVARPKFITPTSQVVLLFITSGFQSIIASMLLVTNEPGVEKTVSDNERFVTIHCKDANNIVKYLLNLMFSIMAQIACTVLAAKTRKYPRDYNEARHIATTLFITVILWSVFLPTISLNKNSDNYFSEYGISVLLCLIGYTTLFGLFLNKLLLLRRNAPPSSTHIRSFSSSECHHREMNMNSNLCNMNSPVHEVNNSVL